MMGEAEYTRICAEMASLWPGSPWTVATIRAGKAFLLDLAPESAMAAVHSIHADGERFAPSPGQVRKRAVELVGGYPPSADQALAEVHHQMARVGSYGTPVWSHVAVGAAVEAMGGWMALCRSEDTMADRAHFLKIYGSAQARHERQAVMPPAVAALAQRLDLSAQRALGPA